MIRIPALERACNFRDLGGYPARDGRCVRWRRMFRSGVLAQLSAADRATVAGFGVRLVCDLRRPDERATQPNPDFGAGVRQVSWGLPQEGAFLRALPAPETIDVTLARRLMMRHYAGMPARLEPHLRGMFGELSNDPGVPTIVHCTAGKDRTGFAAALLLTALGVPREAVIDDYLLTNTAVDLHSQLTNDQSGFGIAPSTRFMVDLRHEAQDVLLAADADYLQAAFDALEASHGSVDAYLSSAIGCDSAMRAQLEQALLD